MNIKKTCKYYNTDECKSKNMDLIICDPCSKYEPKCPLCGGDLKIMWKPDRQYHCRGTCGLIIRVQDEDNEWYQKIELMLSEYELLKGADLIVKEIEKMFPDWERYRDLAECISVTRHESKPETVEQWEEVIKSIKHMHKIKDKERILTEGELLEILLEIDCLYDSIVANLNNAGKIAELEQQIKYMKNCFNCDRRPEGENCFMGCIRNSNNPEEPDLWEEREHV